MKYYCERFSFFLIKDGNDSSTLQAAAVTLGSAIHLLLSTAFSHFSLEKGKMQGDAVALGCSSDGVRLPTVGQATRMPVG